MSSIFFKKGDGSGGSRREWRVETGGDGRGECEKRGVGFKKIWSRLGLYTVHDGCER